MFPPILFSSYLFSPLIIFGCHCLSWMCSLLLYYPPPSSSFSLYPLLLFPWLYTVMYGPCQHWNQWDASCFNLAWEPSGSRSSASWKSDGSSLSFLCLYSPPYALLRCIDQHLAPVGQSSAEAHTIWRPQATARLLTCSRFASLPIDEVPHNLRCHS